MKEKLKNLINVKSIVTIILTILFCSLAFLDKIEGESVLNIYTVIIAFYFGTQFEKQNK